MSEEEPTNTFLISFGTEGGEFVANISEIFEDGVLEKLSSDNATAPIFDAKYSAINSYSLRVRFNAHRHIETYTMSVDESITEDDIWQWFENDAQGLMDILRDRGDLVKQLSCPANFEWTYSPKK